MLRSTVTAKEAYLIWLDAWLGIPHACGRIKGPKTTFTWLLCRQSTLSVRCVRKALSLGFTSEIPAAV